MDKVKAGFDHFSVVSEFTPPWSRRIACIGPTWQSIVEQELPLRYIELSQPKHLKDPSYDAIFLAFSTIPEEAQDFVPFFNALASGGTLILELANKSKWRREQVSRLADSMGAQLKLFADTIKTEQQVKGKLAILQKGVPKSANKKISVVVPVFLK